MDDFPTPTYLQNHEAVVAAFGYWPTFHDSPVLAFTRAEQPSIIKLEVEAWEMTREVDAKGYFVTRKHHIVHFRFTDIVKTDLERFIPENILFELGFSSPPEFEATRQFTVTLDSAMGGDLCGSFVARFGEVTSVLPCDKHAQPV